MPAIFELLEAAMRDDEHLLCLVVDLGLAHAEASQISPHEIDLSWADSAGESGHALERDDGGWHTLASPGPDETSVVEAGMKIDGLQRISLTVLAAAVLFLGVMPGSLAAQITASLP